MRETEAPVTPATGSPAPRLQFIDGARGLAVAMVVVFHAAVWAGLPLEGMGTHYFFDGAVPIELGRLRRILSLGGAGVDLFLAISGFCLFWPLLQGGNAQARPLEVAKYLQRRVRRIVPPYYCAFALLMGVSFLTYRFEVRPWWPWQSFQNAFPWASDAWLNVGAHLLLVHGFFNAYINSYEGAYWSLSTEWQFYFLFIPLAMVARRKGVLWAALIPIAFTAIFRAALSASGSGFLGTPVGVLLSLSRWCEFGAGMLAAAIVSGALPASLTQRFAPLRRLGGIYVAASIWLALVVGYAGGVPDLLPFLWGNASLALLTSGAGSGLVGRALRWRPLVWLGSISYSLYLTHGIVYMAAALVLSRTEISRDVRQILYLLLGPALATGFAALFFVYFEKPFLHKTTRATGFGKAKKVGTAQDQAAP